ncbi:helicase-related protein [Streptomyces sp. NPDC004129]
MGAVGTAGGGGAAPVGRRARELSAEAARLHDAARSLLDDHARAVEAVRTALAPLRAEVVAGELDGIPVARLKDATEGRLRITAIEAAGFATVRSVYEARRHELRRLPGVGQQTADRALAAAGQIAAAVEETVTVRLDVDDPGPRTLALLGALYPLVEAGPELHRAVDAATRLDKRLGTLLPAARTAGVRLRLALLGRRRRQEVLDAVAGIGDVLADAAARGVPENRVHEFRTLVRRLRPDLLPEDHQGGGTGGPGAFRAAIAPVYLRRNQQDVLTELPALVQVDAWEEPSPGDREAYRKAVSEGNFMAMRRAAYADAEHSAKLRRLRELVREAAENGLKVVVFSYFREVLATVRGVLGDGVVGSVSGDVPAARRQRLVDDFAAADGHAVLLAQIEAGGTGLNLQAASVVILCEPQLKPTLEHQAVARARRMGQVRTVQVHRLLATDTVDDRLLRILRNKDRLFDVYARRSEVAEATPDAVDVSDASLARRIVEEEQLRLAAEPA